MGDDTTFYLIKSDILPEILKKTVRAKELLKTGKANTVQDAVHQAGMSRSVFYKYKDSIFPLSEISRGKIITLSFVLEDKPGVLSGILDGIARVNGNILTINQNIPLHGTANVAISIRTATMQENVEDLIKTLEKLKGVQKVEILAQE